MSEAYRWRELTADEYKQLESDTMVFYRLADVIVLTLLLAFGIVLILSVRDILAEAVEKRSDAIGSGLFSAIGIGLLVYGRRFIYHLGFDDFRKHNLVACKGVFVRCEEKTHSRNGSTRYDYYAIVRMPDDVEIKIECNLLEIDEIRTGDTVTVVRPRNSAREQHFMILAQKNNKS